MSPDNRPLEILTDKQLTRLEIVTALCARITVEVSPFDLITWSQWVATGSNIFNVPGETVELESDDTAHWSPAVD